MNLRLTPARVAALVFGLLALAAVLVWAYVDSATTDAWMPTAATGAATIALTVSLVEGIVERERRERGAGRRTAAYERLEDAFIDLNSALTFDLKGEADPRHDPVELIGEWLDTPADATHCPGGTGDPAVIQGIRYFAERMGRVLDEDRDVLPNDLRAAMVEVRERIASMTQTYAVTRGPHTFALHLMLSRTLLDAVLDVAKALRRERGKQWMPILQRLVRIELVPSRGHDADASEEPQTLAQDYVRHIDMPTIDVSEPARPDGFQPLALGLMIWRGVVDFPHDDRFWLMASAARRLDFAHRQIERARAAIDDYTGSPAEALVVLADVESAFLAMHRAIAIARFVNRRFRLAPSFPDFPPVVGRKRRIVAVLRHAYEHIDERAVGVVEGKVEDRAAAHSLFAEGGYGKPLVERREVTYRGWTFGLEDEATELLVALRKFLRDAWVAMCDDELASRVGT